MRDEIKGRAKMSSPESRVSTRAALSPGHAGFLSITRQGLQTESNRAEAQHRSRLQQGQGTLSSKKLQQRQLGVPCSHLLPAPQHSSAVSHRTALQGCSTNPSTQRWSSFHIHCMNKQICLQRGRASVCPPAPEREGACMELTADG